MSGEAARAPRRLEFGTHIDHSDPVGSARMLEAEGFDYVNTGEHMVFHNGTGPSGLIALAAAAAATETIKLFSALVLLPLYPTILLAKMVATLDAVSHGRYNLGIGIGGDYPPEFVAMGIPFRERAARADEALEVLRRGWSEESLTFRGRFHDLRGVTFEPKPVQKPHLPIWVGGRKDGAMRRAGRYGDHWLPYLYTPEMLASSMAVVRDAAESAGRAPTAVRGALLAYFCVYEDRDRARRTAIDHMTRSYKRDFAGYVDKFVIHGTPDDARARLREYHDAGARTVLSLLVGPPEDVDSMRRRLVSDVFPEFRSPA